MQGNNVRTALVLAVSTLLAVTLYYGVIFEGQLPDHRILRGKNDLFLHFFVFAALTIPVRLLWSGWTSLAALAFCAVAIEAIQIFQPGRNATFDDIAASIAGILVGAVFIALLQRGIYRISNSNHK